jgi:hypothetical protein
MCLAETPPRTTVAEVADHIVPVFDDNGVASYERFKLGELQSICRFHHDRVKRPLERGRPHVRRIGPDGWPI